MNAELFDAIYDLEKEKGISAEYLLERMQQALLVALRRDNPQAEDHVIVNIDEKAKTFDVCIQKTVVEVKENPAIELTREEAHKYSKHPQIGDIINVPVDTKKFGRIAAQAAGQVITQGIREAERSKVYDQFTSKTHEILTGVVSKIDDRTGAVTIKISSESEYTEAILPAGECIPGEVLSIGSHIKVYVVEVRRGPQVIISRTHPGLIKRLFELEVPEIFDGTVEIKSIAREAGSRTKMAVASSDPAIEPIGACVGPKGGRVSAIVNELRGEKIDIVKWSENPAEFIAASLAPADVVSVTLSEEGKSCSVIVPDSQLSLAIGKVGQNARLAAKLTGYKIDIKPESKA